ncbi:hypothetical protein CDL12_27001 [Handroanthus impetiginosus]|uniref:Uncharacterized protein n=1 Tax=Handroanthus impetiginosus TaxID=429701 RepID=A0A2G9G5A5_9LAMI|nr:hypothetical protein CDL12_27001 [Handroanthus impetiginosus]
MKGCDPLLCFRDLRAVTRDYWIFLKCFPLLVELFWQYGEILGVYHSIVGLFHVRAVTRFAFCHLMNYLILSCDFGSVSLHCWGCDLSLCFVDLGACHSIGILINGCDS